jgi:hypothetical protein
MIKLLLSLCAFAFSMAIAWQVSADQYVHGYYRSNGTYVQPYHRSSPNGTAIDNYSFRGNLNPYTGKFGTNLYRHDLTSPYYTGPDSHGHVGHASAAAGTVQYDPNPAPGKAQFQATERRDPSNLSLCPLPYRMTAQDGCQR